MSCLCSMGIILSQELVLDGILPVEGTTFSFSCPTGLALIGPNSTICTGNGEWEPDTSEVTCAGITKLIPNFTIVIKDNYEIIP